MKLTFKTNDVLRCVNHALESEKWGMGNETDIPPQPALYLVHDTGVYLMSNGNPGDWIAENESCYVAYADGCHPKIDEYYYETSRVLVGGDDFVEIIPINKDWIEGMSKYDEIHVEITPDNIEVFFAK